MLVFGLTFPQWVVFAEDLLIIISHYNQPIG